MIKIIISVIITIAINVTLSFLASKGTFDFFIDYERKTRERRRRKGE